MADRVSVKIFSDYVCPFCYLGLPGGDRLQRELRDQVEVEWKAFELRPEPAPLLDPRGEYLARVWSEVVYPLARERKMRLRLPPVQPRSRKAFEAAAFARDQGKFPVLHEALFRAFFQEGRDIGQVEVLVEIGGEVGLDRDALHRALASGQYTDRVLQDQAEAGRLRITGVPTHIVGGRHVLGGAQPYAALRAAVEKALEETA